jgi:hypothetical protein
MRQNRLLSGFALCGRYVRALLLCFLLLCSPFVAPVNLARVAVSQLLPWSSESETETESKTDSESAKLAASTWQGRRAGRRTPNIPLLPAPLPCSCNTRVLLAHLTPDHSSHLTARTHLHHLGAGVSLRC